jgi:hypothetical protein
VEVPVLLGTAAEPIVPEDDAAVPNGTIGGDGGAMLLLGDPDGDADRTSMVAEHHVRDDGMAGQYG